MSAAYTPEHYTGQVMLGVAKALQAAGLGVLRESGEYLPGERGIYFTYSPPAASTTPEESLTITPYLSTSGDLAIEETRVQIRARHVNRHPLMVGDYLDAVRAVFPDRTELVFGGHEFDRAYQLSGGTWGDEDRPGVTESTQNFVLRGNRYEP